MEEELSPLAVTHLLQHTLRSLCIHQNSQWVYAVFWRILPRNYPPPKWDSQGAYDTSRGNRKNWILVWEDGFCNFAASAAKTTSGECGGGGDSSGEYQHRNALQPELFFKMSHEIYNYGEGMIGKVAADRGHKWIFKDPTDKEAKFLGSWQNSADSYPRTWEAQFQSGIKTIALIAVREGVVQLGAVHEVMEDMSYVVLQRKKFNYIESIPGVLLPHPSAAAAAAFPFNVDGLTAPKAWHLLPNLPPPPTEFPPAAGYFNINQQPMRITPSMSSLEALLSKLPSVVPAPAPADCSEADQPRIGMEEVAKEEIDEDHHHKQEKHVGESSSSLSCPHLHQQQWRLKGDY